MIPSIFATLCGELLSSLFSGKQPTSTHTPHRGQHLREQDFGSPVAGGW